MLKICVLLAVVATTASGQCESGWSPFGQSCYRLFTAAQLFDAQRVTCENRGGWLVSINSAEENTFIKDLQHSVCGTSACHAYIGLRRNSAGQFINWLDGKPFGGNAYSNWNAGEPNNIDGSENCVELFKDSGKWNDIACNHNRWAVCEKRRTECDSGWSPFAQSCYLIFPGAQSFDDHRANCENHGGWLVSISSAEENAFVNHLQIAECGSGACYAYIGLVWHAGQVSNWLDGTPFDGSAYSNWHSGEPSNFEVSDNCVQMIRNNGKWDDMSCGNDRVAMCEKPQPATWCAAGWSPFGQCCYRLLTALQSFDAHKSDCQNSGGQLVSIRSAAENNFVQLLLQSGCPGSSGCSGYAAYIGIRRDSAGQFTSWLDDSPFGWSFYSNWNSGEPNHVGGSENCGEILQSTGKWNDISCNVDRIAVCKNCQPPTTTTSTTTTTTTTTTPTTTTPSTTTTTPTTTTTATTSTTTTASTTMTTSTTTTPSTTTPTTTTTTRSTTKSPIIPTTPTSTTVRAFDCRTVRTNVNCGAANGPAACDAQCRLFRYGQGICYIFGTTPCYGYRQGSKGCLCYDTLDCRTLRTQVNCAAANAALSCTNWCKLFQWTQGACTTFTSSWTCPGYVAGQKACLCQ